MLEREDLLEDDSLVCVCNVLELGLKLIINSLQISPIHLFKGLVLLQRRVPLAANTVAQHHSRWLHFYFGDALLACTSDKGPARLLLDVATVVATVGAIIRTIIVMAEVLAVQGIIDDLEVILTEACLRIAGQSNKVALMSREQRILALCRGIDV